MNDPIEDALKDLKPAELPPALMARLTAARSQIAQGKEAKENAPAGWGILRWLLPAGATAAIAAVTVTVLNWTGGVSNPDGLTKGRTPNAPIPFESEDHFLGAREVGLVVPPNNRTPFRLMEVEWLEADTIRPQDGGPAVRVETKRRGVVPVELRVF